MEEPISYKVLRKVQQAEQSASVLSQLDGSFYVDIQAYLRALDQNLLTEKNPQKSRLFADELANTKKLIEGVYALREKKIVSAALVAARGGVPDIKNVLDEERPLYDTLVQVIGRVRKTLLAEEPLQEKAADAPAVSSGVSAAPVEVQVPVRPPVVSVNPHPLVRVVQDMPAFVGTDLRVYELHKDDVLSLPQEIAGPLLKRGVLTPIS
jgi:DNA replication initiation complex subunit (GINS family)